MLTTNRKQNILVKLASKAEAAKQTASGVWQAIKGSLGKAKDVVGEHAKGYGKIVAGEGTAASKAGIAKAEGKESLLAAQGIRRKELAKRTAAIGVPAAGVAGGIYGMGKGSGKKKARKNLGLTKSEYKSLTKSLKKANA